MCGFQNNKYMYTTLEGRHLTCNLSVVGSNSIKGSRCFLEQETI